MEGMLQSWLLVVAAAGIVALGLLWKTVSPNKSSKQLPPGPSPWPIVGNLPQLKLPIQRTLETLSRKHGPVMFLRMGSMPAVVISSSFHAKQFFKSNDLSFLNRPNMLMGEVLFYNYKNMGLSNGDYWKSLRKICAVQLLSPKIVASFKEIRYHELDLMVQSVWEKSCHGEAAVDITKEVSELMSNIVWLTIAGRKFADEEIVFKDLSFKRLADEISAAGSVGNIGDFIPWLKKLDVQGLRRRLYKVHQAFDALVETLIRDHETRSEDIGGEEKPKDFVDILLEIEKDNSFGFGRDNVKSLIIDMFASGSQTTATLIEWVMSFLIKNPNTMRKLQEEIDSVVGREQKVKEEHLPKMKYLHCVIKETLRLYNPLPLGAPHMSTEESVVCGYTLPKGCLVIMNHWAIGRDPSMWEDAEEFKPERFMEEDPIDIIGYHDMKMVPFSAGRRGCPGSNVAIPVSLMTTATLLQCFEWSVNEDLDMNENFGIAICRKFPLVATPKPRVKWIPK